MIDLCWKKREAKRRHDEVQRKNLAVEIQRKLRRNTNNWISRQCTELDELDRNRKSKDLFAKVSKIKNKPFSQDTINDANGNMLSDPTEVLGRWKEYAEKLFEKPIEEASTTVELSMDPKQGLDSAGCCSEKKVYILWTCLSSSQGTAGKASAAQQPS